MEAITQALKPQNILHQEQGSQERATSQQSNGTDRDVFSKVISAAQIRQFDPYTELFIYDYKRATLFGINMYLLLEERGTDASQEKDRKTIIMVISQ